MNIILEKRNKTNGYRMTLEVTEDERTDMLDFFKAREQIQELQPQERYCVSIITPRPLTAEEIAEGYSISLKGFKVKRKYKITNPWDDPEMFVEDGPESEWKYRKLALDIAKKEWLEEYGSLGGL